MYTLLINDVPQILKLSQAKGAFLQVSTQLVMAQGLKDMSNKVEVLFPTLAKDKMSSKYTTMNVLVKGRRMSSISLMKIAGAFVNSNELTNHLKRPSLDLKEISHTSEGSIGTW